MHGCQYLDNFESSCARSSVPAHAKVASLANQRKNRSNMSQSHAVLSRGRESPSDLILEKQDYLNAKIIIESYGRPIVQTRPAPQLAIRPPCHVPLLRHEQRCSRARLNTQLAIPSADFLRLSRPRCCHGQSGREDGVKGGGGFDAARGGMERLALDTADEGRARSKA